MKYVKSFGLPLLFIGLTFVIMKLCEYIFYHSPLHGITGFAGIIDKNPHIPAALWYFLTFLLLALFTGIVKKKNIFSYCGFKKISRNEVLIMMYIGAGAFLFNTAFINISFIDKNFPQFDKYLVYNYEHSHILLGILSSIILGPILEEVLFRGLIFKELKNALPLLPAAIISSVLYGILFFDIPLILFCVAAGLLYTFIYVQTNNLVPMYVLHFVATGAVLFSRRLGIENLISDIGDIYIIPAFGLSIVIIISGAWLLWREKQKQPGITAQPAAEAA